MKPRFEPVTFPSVRKICASPLAVTVHRQAVKFRFDKDMAKECGMKKGMLLSAYHDPSLNLIALVEDNGNESGEAKKVTTEGKARSWTIEFPRRDLFAQLWPDIAPIQGLKLYAERAQGKIVFHVRKASGKESS